MSSSVPSKDIVEGGEDVEEVDDCDDANIERADKEAAEDRLLAAARILQRVLDTSKLTSKHLWILQKSMRAEQVVRELSAEPGDEWSKQGESHGRYDTVIYYKVVDSMLTARIETPIEQSLVIPLLAVFNETELYTTWLPRWERPIRLGVRGTKLLRQDGRCNQLIMATTDMPWPLATRECIIDVVAIDDIDANGAVVVKMETGSDDDPDVPAIEKSTVRIDFDGGILFRKCPRDHPAFSKSKHKPDHDMVLVCLTMFVDPKVQLVPQSLINFVTRTVLGGMWTSLLKVAEDVRDGKRPLHAQAMDAKRDLVYDFMQRRIAVMLSAMKQEVRTTVSGDVNKEELGAVLGFL
ncbi:hypothetical protein MHU86_13151 [Fragilaria crotonensis]|nr:hypothetical protein MHU86_13151 [Fragilaria crotonensis]